MTRIITDPKTSLQITHEPPIISWMINRSLAPLLEETLDRSPAVAILGPRQVGKTTLALAAAEARGKPFVYLDLESEQDRNKLAQAELYLADQSDKLVILDEVHRTPGLFPVLRGLIDHNRRRGHSAGQYLLLGSASLDVLKQSGETLAGRISYLELPPFGLSETSPMESEQLWVRGGFPESFLASSDASSLKWRQDFIRTYLERDIPAFGPRISTETLRRFWIMLAHHQGGLLNASQLANNLGIDVKTVNNYLDLLTALLLVRRLPPWHANIGKRLVKSPKIYIRDSGLTHSLLGIGDKDNLLSHPVIGQSWEGFVIENLLNSASDQAQGYFYRSSGGAEIDLVLSMANGELWAIEVKRSLTPKVERGFFSACTDIKPKRKLVVYPGLERYRLAEDIEAVPLFSAIQELPNQS